MLGVSTSGYYAWRRRPPSRRAQANRALSREIAQIHEQSRGTYGARRVQAQLRVDGSGVSRRRVARLMRAGGLQGVTRRRVTTTRRDPQATVAADQVRREFHAEEPNRLWVADITYVPTAEGFVYLATVLDVFSRVDKPMRGHGLMQAIARVNRVFRDKPGGLVVDYLGLAHELKRALATYTENGGRGETALNQDQAVRVMQEKYEICCGLFHGFDRSAWANGSPAQRLHLLPTALEHVLAQEDGKARCLKAVRELSQAFALAVPHPEAIRIRDDLSLFQHVRAALSKRTRLDAKPEEELDHAVRQIVSRAVAQDGVLDIFAAAGLTKPDVSILSEEFLLEVRGMRRRNLAVELLERLLKGELSMRRRKNVVQARSFAELLERTIRRYQNRAVEAAQVIEELIALARDLRESSVRGEALGLSDDELAFYDALGVNDSAVQVLDDETLRDIARELVDTVRSNVTIDWTLRENVRAKLRVLVKRVLRKHGYPPDRQESATRTVLEQAEVLSAAWAS